MRTISQSRVLSLLMTFQVEHFASFGVLAYAIVEQVKRHRHRLAWDRIREAGRPAVEPEGH
jgi:hypothetical protein